MDDQLARPDYCYGFYIDNERLKLWLLSPLAMTFLIAFKQQMKQPTKVKFINNTNLLHVH
ncbi:acetate--CoA ligase [Vibrio splendidus]|nr:acetate--CoA ligase [Vibrio splendidus]